MYPEDLGVRTFERGGVKPRPSTRPVEREHEDGQGARRHSEVDLSFAVWLSHQLRRRRLTQRELARRAGMAHSTVSRILLGERAPSWPTLQRLAIVVGNPPPNVLLGRFGVRARAGGGDTARDWRP
jgi:DNA-binding XRE family transcriptional regulator